MSANVESKPANRPIAFACESCRIGKRRCDGAKPRCVLCTKHDRECIYQTENRTRKRKYWDENYVQSLESQVESLRSLLLQRNQIHRDPSLSTTRGPSNATDVLVSELALGSLPAEIPTNERAKAKEDHGLSNARSEVAMEELSVMMWRTNLGDGVTITNDDDLSTEWAIHNPSKIRTIPDHIQAPQEIITYCQVPGLLEGFASLFLKYINQDHQFTEYDTSTDFLNGFPSQPVDCVFLHAAIVAVGSTFSHAPDAQMIGDAFERYAESLASFCCRYKPSLYVVQGLVMLSWRCLALGEDHFGWVYSSMAAGMAVHLRLHVLALDESAGRLFKPDQSDIRTFWMFFMTDWSAISILGRNCVLPWRRANVPDFARTFDGKEPTLDQIAFTWQCKLWYMHDQNIEKIFSPTFETLDRTEQVLLLLSTNEALFNLFRKRDPSLHLSKGFTPKPIILFHLTYHMATLITMPSFLKIFTSSTSASIPTIRLILRSLFYAASSTTRLVQIYHDSHSFQHANPVIIHHLLSASIVHLMNSTATNVVLKRRSTRLLRQSFALFAKLALKWPVRSQKSIAVIKVLAHRWGSSSSLPPAKSFDSAYEEDQHSRPENPSETTTIPEFPDNNNIPPERTIADTYDQCNYVDTNGDLDIMGQYATPDLHLFDGFELGSASRRVEPIDLFQVFGGLNSNRDFTWLFGS